MLRLLPVYSGAALTRTRDPASLEACDIVVDVGGRYDEIKWFDHHQRGFETTFSPKHQTKLSSAGLVYKHFGKGIIKAIAATSAGAGGGGGVSSPGGDTAGPDAKRVKTETEQEQQLDDVTLDTVHVKVYEDFVEGIDAQDNGISPYPDASATLKFKPALSLPGMVSHLNPDWNEASDPQTQDKLFQVASQLVGSHFTARVVRTLSAWLPARSLVRQFIESRLSDASLDDVDRQILVLDGKYLPWKEHLYDVESALGKEGFVKFVIYHDGSWRVQAVSISNGSFVSRIPMPEAWRGLRDAALDAKLHDEHATDLPGAVFVHAAGFIGGHATKEGALAMARTSIARASASSA